MNGVLLADVGRWSEGLEAEGHYIFILPLDSLMHVGSKGRPV